MLDRIIARYLQPWKTIAAWSLLLLIGMVSSAHCADGLIVMRDAQQHEVRFEHAPRRIVTLLPSLTETVCALGECARLVATDRYSNWPESVQRLPKTGGLDDVQIEPIVRLKPDVVLLGNATRVIERLRELGIVAFVFETETYADISRNVSTIGQMLGVADRAAALNLEIENSVADAASGARTALQGRTPLVYYEVDSAPYGAGPQSFIGELLTRLGAKNILGSELGAFPRINPEYVVQSNPEVIFASPKDLPDLALRPGWDHIKAVKENRLCSFPPEVRDTIVRSGPRVAEGLRAIADCLTRVAP